MELDKLTLRIFFFNDKNNNDYFFDIIQHYIKLIAGKYLLKLDS